MGQTFLVEEIRGEMLKGLGSLRFGILFWGGGWCGDRPFENLMMLLDPSQR